MRWDLEGLARYSVTPPREVITYQPIGSPVTRAPSRACTGRGLKSTANAANIPWLHVISLMFAVTTVSSP